MVSPPLMTETGTFVINGAEVSLSVSLFVPPEFIMRLIMIVCVRSRKGSLLLYRNSEEFRGAWLEYETDSNDIFMPVWIVEERFR